jgi:hypothetical protein
MPYSRESKGKDTHAKESKQDNASHEYQLASQGGGTAPPFDEGLSAGSGYERLFAFIREAHLKEAQEFRLKGYNSQVPDVDERLLTQLRDGLAAAKSRLCLQVSVGGPLGSLWLLDQIGNIERLTNKLSDGVIKRWIEHELPRKNTAEAAESELGSRRMAQSLARRLESTLETLIRVVRTLRAMDDYSTSGKRRDMLVCELTVAFSSSDKSMVIQALERMTAETSGHAAWASLMQVREAAWEAGKSTTVDAMIAASRHEAEKANKKARQLQGDPQTFFSDVATYLQNLSSDLAKASIHAGHSSASPSISQMNNDGAAASLSRSNSLSRGIETGIDKKVPIVYAGAKVQALRLVRILKHGHLAGTPTKDHEHVVADSIIRSILWQWQQPAIKIQYVSAALLSKVDELKKIEGILASYSTADDKRSEQVRRNTPSCPSGEEGLVAQVREWVNDSLEQAPSENQRAEKVKTLERLLSGDIASARGLVERLGKTGESIQNMLRRQRLVVLKMIVNLLSDISPSLKAVDELLPDIAGDLTASIAALDKAHQAASYATRDFSEAKTQAENAQLLATKVKKRLSAESARLTERPLDDYSRGSRLAKHWANLANAQNEGNNPPADAQQVLASLKEQGLLAGTLSTGDPAGYLFATRLAGELENARHDELILPMSPEQYAALEKGLVEYIVKWGQKRISREVTRIVIELSFEQALNAVSFNVSRFFRLPYKVLKASIKIPYSVNKVNHYTMPGHDKPYKAIYGLLGKKLKQLGFNLLTVPAPGTIKLAMGAGLTVGAALHNVYVGRNENTFSAVYKHVAEGKQSEKIKMDSVGEMIFDSVLDTATTATFKGAQRGWQAGRNANNAISDNAFVSKHVAESNEEPHPQTQWREMVADNNNPPQENAAADGREAMPVSHSSPLQPQTDVGTLSDEHGSDASQLRVRHKRAMANTALPSSPQWHDNISSDVKFGHFNFDRDIHYKDLSYEMKKQTYIHGIQFVLYQIENDRRLSQRVRDNACRARVGDKLLVPVDIKGYKLNNTIFLPDRPSAKSGVLIRLDSDIPYYYVDEGKDLLEDVKYAMPHNADKRDVHKGLGVKITVPSGIDILNNIRCGIFSFEKNFNCNKPNSMDIASLSDRLANTMEADYKLKGETITNKLLISRAFENPHIFAPDSLAIKDESHLGYTWAEYFDIAIRKLKSKNYKLRGKFNIREESYLKLKEKMYKDEREGKKNTIKLPADEIDANGDMTSESINILVMKLKKKIASLKNKKNEGNVLVNYESEITKLSLFDMKSLIKYLNTIDDEGTIAKINGYIPKGNYEDLIFADDLAQEIVSKMKNFSESFSKEELSAVIYKVTMEKGFSSVNLTRIYNKFILDKERLNPFSESLPKEKPAGYFTISDFKKSGDTGSRSAFNQQFYDYRDKYNKYDAGILSGSIIAGSRITLDEFNNKPRSVQTWAVFGKSLVEYTNSLGESIDPSLNPAQYIPGRVILMQLSSGRYLLVSNLLGSVRSVLLTEQEGDDINSTLAPRKLVSFEKGWFNNETDKRYKQYNGLYYFNQVNEMIIKPLYGNDWNNNPIRHISHQYFTLAKDDKAKSILIDDKSTVSSTLTQGLEVAQAAYVEMLHEAMDETDPTWKVIRGFIPFYNIIYNSSTDSEYEIDSGELLLDLASVIPVAKAAGATAKSVSGIMKSGRSALKAGMQNGLRGFDLFKYVAKQVSPDLLSAASKNSLLMTKAFYDAIEPVPIRSTFKSLYKGVKSDLTLTSLDDFSGAALARENIKGDLELTNDGVLIDNSGQNFIRGEKGDLYHVKKNKKNNGWVLVNGYNKKTIINSGGRWWVIKNTKITGGLFRKGWEVNEINFEGVHSDRGIYKIRPDNPQSMQDYNYYIKNNNKFYQVKYDGDNNTLRLINPNSPSRLGYFPPIKLNKNNKWVFNNNIGLKGGGMPQKEQASTSVPPAPAIPHKGEVSSSVPPAPAIPQKGQVSTSVLPSSQRQSGTSRSIEFKPGEDKEAFSVLKNKAETLYHSNTKSTVESVDTTNAFDNRYSFIKTEASAPSNVSHLTEGKLYNLKIGAKSSETPAYDLYISKDGKNIITSSSYKKDDITQDPQYGNPLPYSEIMFNALKKSGVDPKELIRSTQASIENSITQSVISAIGTRIQRGQVIVVSPTNTPEAFFTLLGTDNCKATLFMLTQHAEEFGHKTITSIEFKGTGYLVMNIG